MKLIEFNPFPKITDESIGQAERLAKLPGVTLGDLRAVLGLPRLEGINSYLNDHFIIDPHGGDRLWDDDEALPTDEPEDEDGT